MSWSSLRNLENVHVLVPDQLNTYDVLCADDIVFTEEALSTFLAGPTKGRLAKAGVNEAAVQDAPPTDEPVVPVDKPAKAAAKPARVAKTAKAAKAAGREAKKAVAADAKQEAKDAKQRAKARAKAARDQRKRGGDS